jgi:PglZ domain.
MLKDIVCESFICSESLYFSILPTATPYARNSVFSGLMPRHISEMFPDIWVDEAEEEGKNLLEELLIQSQLERLGRKNSFSYHKINSNREGEKLVARFPELEKKELNVMVFNFIDMLSHARTESEMIRELAPDEAAYRSLTRSWFLHSPLLPLLRKIAQKGYKAVLTTDHGAIRVKNGVKVIGDKETNVNLRYKLGKNLAYEAKKVFDTIHPENFGLPSPNISTRYIFAVNSDFFVYPNNYHHYLSYYENTFQHGGVSMEEMMVPLITLTAK